MKFQRIEILFSMILYSAGFKDIIFRETIIYGRGNVIAFHLVGNNASYLGYVLMLLSFLLLSAFLQDLKNNINSNYLTFNFKLFFILLIIFAIMTPIVLILLHCTDIIKMIRIMFFIFYLIYTICFLWVFVYL